MEDKYLYMIQKAQEFMNENHFADVSRVQCLLRISPLQRKVLTH